MAFPFTTRHHGECCAFGEGIGFYAAADKIYGLGGGEEVFYVQPGFCGFEREGVLVLLLLARGVFRGAFVEQFLEGFGEGGRVLRATVEEGEIWEGSTGELQVRWDGKRVRRRISFGFVAVRAPVAWDLARGDRRTCEAY